MRIINMLDENALAPLYMKLSWERSPKAAYLEIDTRNETIAIFRYETELESNSLVFCVSKKGVFKIKVPSRLSHDAICWLLEKVHSVAKRIKKGTKTGHFFVHINSDAMDALNEVFAFVKHVNVPDNLVEVVDAERYLFESRDLLDVWPHDKALEDVSIHFEEAAKKSGYHINGYVFLALINRAHVLFLDVKRRETLGKVHVDELLRRGKITKEEHGEFFRGGKK